MVPGRVSFFGEVRVDIAVTRVSFFVFQNFQGSLQNLGFVKAGSSRKLGIVKLVDLLVPVIMIIIIKSTGHHL